MSTQVASTTVPIIKWNELKEIIRKAWPAHIENRKNDHRMNDFYTRAKSLEYDQKFRDGLLAFTFSLEEPAIHGILLPMMLECGLNLEVQLYGMISHDTLTITIKELEDLDQKMNPEPFVAESLTFVEDFEPG